jgi:F-type H+-transporting ATPase subunit delta
MEEIARVYADAVFAAAKDKGNLDAVHEQLGEFADVLADNRDMQVFFFSPYFSSNEKREGLARAIEGAEPELLNFLELLIDKHRTPVLFRIRRHFDALWAKENKRLAVTVTSAVELDPSVADRIGDEIGRQTGRTVELTSSVDPDVIGGIVVRVGNSILDASIRTRLENLRKQVAKA